MVARNGKVFYHKAFGFHTSKKEARIQKTDLYDLASLTKILASLPLLMRAEEENKLSLNSKLSDLLPRFKNSNKGYII